MAKLNEGDVMEGIFAIGLCLYIAYGKIDKRQLNKLRAKIEPAMFSTGKFSVKIVKNLQRQHGKKPPDVFNVNLSVRLKPASVTGAFGKDLSMLLKTCSDIGNIDKKIDALIKSTETSSWAGNIKSTIDKFLNNNVGEIITFECIADGIAGETSGGKIKSDVDLNIYASKAGGTRKPVLKHVIPFSLKSESVTVANMSPYNGMKDIAEAFDLKWKKVEKYKKLGETARTPAEKKYKFALIETMYAELSKLIFASKSTINDKAYDFLFAAIFGSDLANVVDIQRKKVKEITVHHFNFLRKHVILDVQLSGAYIKFLNKQDRSTIFLLRTKLRPPPAANGSGEAKFYLEVGQGIYG